MHILHPKSLSFYSPAEYDPGTLELLLEPAHQQMYTNSTTSQWLLLQQCRLNSHEGQWHHCY